MNPLSWDRIQSVYQPTPERHAKAARLMGLNCAPEVFAALFHARHEDRELGILLRDVDFSAVNWVREERSGTELRQVFVPRSLQPAVDEAYRDILDEASIHERTDVGVSWKEHGTWVEPPILAAGELLGSAAPDTLLVGSTRLGCLLAFLGQGMVGEGSRHVVWMGRTKR